MTFANAFTGRAACHSDQQHATSHPNLFSIEIHYNRFLYLAKFNGFFVVPFFVQIHCEPYTPAPGSISVN